MADRSPHWTAYLGGLIVLAGLLYQLASAWFDLQYRVRALEERSRYLHGTWSLSRLPSE